MPNSVQIGPEYYFDLENFKLYAIYSNWNPRCCPIHSESFSNDILLHYILNNVRMSLNIISISQSPNRMLFDPTDTPDNVRPIQNRFCILKSQNCMYMLFNVANSVRMDPNIIVICKIPNRMLLDTTDTLANVWPIQKEIWIIWNPNRIIITHLHTTHCRYVPEYYFNL